MTQLSYTDIENKLKKYNLTSFQKSVLLATAKIPKGKTISYKMLAKNIGKPNAFRAVGTALKNNPLPITIPCHRVIKSNGEIGSYSYGGTLKKRNLLKNEKLLNNKLKL